jgi:hypothetical protein
LSLLVALLNDISGELLPSTVPSKYVLQWTKTSMYAFTPATIIKLSISIQTHESLFIYKVQPTNGLTHFSAVFFTMINHIVRCTQDTLSTAELKCEQRTNTATCF